MALLKPTKENFLKILMNRIKEYEDLGEEDLQLFPGCYGALMELKNIKQLVMTMIEEE